MGGGDCPTTSISHSWETSPKARSLSSQNRARPHKLRAYRPYAECRYGQFTRSSRTCQIKNPRNIDCSVIVESVRKMSANSLLLRDLRAMRPRSWHTLGGRGGWNRRNDVNIGVSQQRALGGFQRCCYSLRIRRRYPAPLSSLRPRLALRSSNQRSVVGPSAN